MIGRAFAIADRWSWAMLRQRYNTGADAAVLVAVDQREPQRGLSHEHREALEWLSHRGMIEVAPDFASVRLLMPEPLAERAL